MLPLPDSPENIAYQRLVQAGHNTFRTLHEYDALLTDDRIEVHPHHHPVARMLGVVGVGNDILVTCLQEEQVRQQAAQLHWVDLPSGHAVAMRQARKLHLGDRDTVAMTAADLLYWSPDTLGHHAIRYLSYFGIDRSIFAPDFAPERALGAAETIRLPRPAHVITSVQGIQYFLDPLGAIANMYNNLADNGVAVIATGTPWTSRITQTGMSSHEFFSGLFDRLDAAGIESAGTHVSKHAGRAALIAIRRSPGTALQQPSPQQVDRLSGGIIKAVYPAGVDCLQVVKA